MTEADRITAVLAEHGAGFRYDSQNYLCTAKACDGLRFRDEDEHAAHVTAAVLAELEKTHAIVELPAQMVDRSNVAEPLRSLPMWATGRSWTCLRDPETIEYETEDQNIYGIVTPAEARAFAAALLAAVHAARSAEKAVRDE